MLTDQTRDEVFSRAKPAQNFLYSHPSSGEILFSVAQKYDLHKDEAYKTFAITVGDIILGFYRTEDTVPLLQQELGLDPRTAALLGADVLDFLAPLSDPTWQPPIEEENGVDEDIPADDTGFVEEVSAQTTTLPIRSIEDDPVSSAPYSETNPQTRYTPPVAYNTSLPLQADNTPSNPTHQPTIATHTHVAPASPAEPTTPLAPIPPDPNAPLHTMASDMAYARAVHTQEQSPAPLHNHDQEPAYVSQNQDALRQSLSSVPSYTPSPAPRVTPPAHDPEPPRWSAH